MHLVEGDVALSQGINQTTGATAVPQVAGNGQVVLEVDDGPAIVMDSQGGGGQMGENAPQSCLIDDPRGLLLL